MDAIEIQHEDDLLIINDVARAIEENEFEPYVQPCFDLVQTRPMLAETFARWTFPEDGTLIPAAAFIPALERTNTVCGLDWFIIDAMCAFLGEQLKTAMIPPVALNISSQHVSDENFAKRLLATTDWRGVDPIFVSVEFGQNTIAKDERLARTLIPSLLDAGFSVVADKFNASPEALVPLMHMGIATVKVSTVLWRDSSIVNLRALTRAADELGIVLIAEGVETTDELKMLRHEGFLFAQGYHLARPMCLEEYAKLCSGRMLFSKRR
ncbi:MAG: EAL domain-containing protein [Atopobiaceae bacterium]|nr:EAL domain-containing protein [Atopobiaceae bacterium]